MGANITMLQAKRSSSDKIDLSQYQLPSDHQHGYLDFIQTSSKELEVLLSDLRRVFPNCGIELGLTAEELGRRSLSVFRVLSSVLLFSRLSFEEKLADLLRHFDFNQVHVFSSMDVEVLVYFVLVSGLRRLGLDETPEKEGIRAFVLGGFSGEESISPERITSFLGNCRETVEFCEVLELRPPDLHIRHRAEEVFKKEEAQADRPSFIKWERSTRRSKREKSSVTPKTPHSSAPVDESGFTVMRLDIRPKWSFGWSAHRYPQSLLYHCTSDQMSIDEKLIFPLSSQVAVMYLQTKSEEFYGLHDHSVSAIDLCPVTRYVTSVDTGPCPSIHLWDPSSMTLLQKATLRTDIEVLFVRYIASTNEVMAVGHSLEQRGCTLVILNMESGLTTGSLHLDEFLIGLNLFESTVHDIKVQGTEVLIGASAVAFSEVSLIVVYRSADEGIKVFKWTGEAIGLGRPKETITDVVAIVLNTEHPFLNFCVDKSFFSLLMLVSTSEGRVLGLTDDPYTPQGRGTSRVIVDLESRVVALHTLESPFLVCLTENLWLHLIDFLYGKRVVQMDLGSYSLSLNHPLVPRRLLVNGPKSVFVQTEAGEVIRVDISSYKLYEENESETRGEVSPVAQVTVLPRHLTCLSVYEAESDNIVVVGSREGVLSVVSSKNHSVVWKMSLGDEITAVDCLSASNGDFLIAVGTSSGKLRLVRNWAEGERMYDCERAVSMVRFSAKGLFLLAASDFGRLYKFIFHHEDFFDLKPEFVDLGPERIPISVLFCLDFSVGVIETRSGHFLKMHISDLRSVEEVGFYDLVIPKSHLLGFRDRRPMFFEQELRFHVEGAASGRLVLKRNQSEPPMKVKGHNSKVVGLRVDSRVRRMYTVSESDGTLMVWSIGMDVEVKGGDGRLKGEGEGEVDERSMLVVEVEQKILLRKLFLEERTEVGGRRSGVESLSGRMQPWATDLPSLEPQVTSLTPHLILSNVLGMDTLFNFRNAVLFLSVPEDLHDLFTRLQGDVDEGEGGEGEEGGEVVDPAEIISRNKLVYESVGKGERSLLRDNERNWETNLEHLSRVLIDKVASDSLDHDMVISDRSSFAFFTGVYVVVQSIGVEGTRRVFRKHQARVTALECHPSGLVLCSSDMSDRPRLLVWFPWTLTLISEVRSKHQGGVAAIAFFGQGSLMVTASTGKDARLEVACWRTGELLASQRTSDDLVLAIRTCPVKSGRFFTLVLDGLTKWSFVNRSIKRHWTLKQSTFLKGLFLDVQLLYISSEERRRDLMVLTSQGVLLVICRRELVYTSRSLGESIRCLSLLKGPSQEPLLLFSDRRSHLTLVTLSLKERLSISFDEVLPEHAKDTEVLFVHLLRSNSVHVDLRKKRARREGERIEVSVLVGLSTGDLLHVALPIKDPMSEEPTPTIDMRHLQSVPNSRADFGSNYLFYTKNYRKLLIASHSLLPVVALAGQDRSFRLFSDDLSTCLFWKRLETDAFMLHFVVNADILLVGTISGTVVALLFKFDGVEVTLLIEQVIVRHSDLMPIAASSQRGEIGETLVALSFGWMKTSVESSVVDRPPRVEVYELVVSRSNSRNTPSKHSFIVRQISQIAVPSWQQHHTTSLDNFSRVIHRLVFSTQSGKVLLCSRVVNKYLASMTDAEEDQYLVFDFKFRKLSKEPMQEEEYQCAAPDIGVDVVLDGRHVAVVGIRGETVVLGDHRGDLVVTSRKVLLEMIAERKGVHSRVHLRSVTETRAHVGETSAVVFNWDGSKVLTCGYGEGTACCWIVVKGPMLRDSSMEGVSGATRVEERRRVYDPLRGEVLEARQDVDRSQFPSFGLSAHLLIGRNARMLNGNLYLNRNKEVVYCSGSQVVQIKVVNEGCQDVALSNRCHLLGDLMMMVNESASVKSEGGEGIEVSERKGVDGVKQRIHSVTRDSDLGVNYEISCIDVSRDGSLLVVGLTQVNSKMRIFDGCSFDFSDEVSLDDGYLPFLVKVNRTNTLMSVLYVQTGGAVKLAWCNLLQRHTSSLVATILVEDYLSVVSATFVSVVGEEILVVLTENQMMTWWSEADRLKSKIILETSVLETFKQSLASQLVTSTEEDNEGVTMGKIEEMVDTSRFTSVASGDDGTLFVGTSSGVLVVRDRKGGLKVHLVFKDLTSVTCMEVMEGSQALFIGGTSSVSFITVDSSGYVLTSRVISLESTSPLQSLAFDSGARRLVIGLRSGAIDSLRVDGLERVDCRLLSRDRLCLELLDDEVPKQVTISHDSRFVFVVSTKGLFTVYELQPELRSMRKLQTFMEVRDVHVLEERVMLVYESQALIFFSRDGFFEPTRSIFDADNTLLTSCIDPLTSNLICHFRNELSLEFTLVVFATSAEILEKRVTIETTEHSLIDYSSNGLHVLFMSDEGLIRIVDNSQEMLEVNDVDRFEEVLQGEWKGEARRLGRGFSFAKTFYNSDNPIVNTVMLDSRTLVIADRAGTVD